MSHWKLWVIARSEVPDACGVQGSCSWYVAAFCRDIVYSLFFCWVLLGDPGGLQ